ncbi:MAG: tyrosine-type recombinase/integrase [Nakamurella sp.]
MHDDPARLPKPSDRETAPVELGVWSRIVAGLPEDVLAYQAASLSPNTLRAYRADWGSFERWCRLHGHAAFPSEPGIVATYIAALAAQVTTAGKPAFTAATIGRRLAAISKIHEMAGHPSPAKHPAVTTTMSGIRRQLGTRPKRVAPLTLTELAGMLARMTEPRYPTVVGDTRDTALLLIGFAGAFRRSELAALTAGDVSLHPEDGLRILVRRSKTDQEGAGTTKAIPRGAHLATCPVCAMIRWHHLVESHDIGGRRAVLRALATEPDRETHICSPGALVAPADPRSPLWRSVHKSGAIGPDPITGTVVLEVVKRRAKAAGLDPSTLGGHSLRAGFVTQATRAGADTPSIMRQTGHRSPATVDIYRREADPLAGNAVTKLGL